jgi:hypothetical protein
MARYSRLRFALNNQIENYVYSDQVKRIIRNMLSQICFLLWEGIL